MRGGAAIARRRLLARHSTLPASCRPSKAEARRKAPTHRNRLAGPGALEDRVDHALHVGGAAEGRIAVLAGLQRVGEAAGVAA